VTEVIEMAVNGVIWLTAQDYNRLRTLLAELTRQSRGIQAGLDTLEDIRISRASSTRRRYPETW
jgi:hypothetical protein